MQHAIFRLFALIFIPLWICSEELDLPTDCVLADDALEEMIEEAPERRAKSPEAESEAVPAPSYLETAPCAVIAGRVSAISGDLIESQVDLFLPGPKSLLVQRSWNGHEKQWNFAHFGSLKFWKSDEKYYNKGCYIDDTGSSVLFHRSSNVFGLKVPKKMFRKGLTNCSAGEISGQTHWRNATLYTVKQNGHRRKLLRHGSHTDRFFKYAKTDHHKARCYRLEEERHPGSVHFLYGYKGKRLNSIRCFDREKHLLQELNIKREPHAFVWSSDDQEVRYTYDRKRRRLLDISSSQAPSTTYLYDTKNRLTAKRDPLGVVFVAHYLKKNKVRTLMAPVGKEGAIVYTHRFSYRKHSTNVIDAEGHHTKYIHFGKKLRKIVRYDNDIPVAEERFMWDRFGRLRLRKFTEGEKVLFAKKLSYDAYNNIKSETLTGDLTGVGTVEDYTKTFRSSQDGWNLPLEENDGLVRVRYSYYPKTNLLKSRLTGSPTAILKREFFAYDSRGTCIEEIVDDGSAEEVEDLTGVTERHLKKIDPTQAFPFGVPEKVEEFFIDLQTQEYHPLRTTVFGYSAQGKKISEAHYGSDGALAFTLYWDYDAYGNLLSATNALGQSVVYTYDAVGNKTSEQHPHLLKQYSYDKAHRLVEEKECWPDGTCLTTQHRYNALSQKIATVDPFGNETLYKYDAYGFLCETTRPPIYGADTPCVERITNNALGHKMVFMDALGHQTHTRYTVRGQPSWIQHPNGSISRQEYSLAGHLVKEVAENGRETLYTRDLFGRVTRTESGEKVVTAVYNTFHLLSKTDALGCTKHYCYDGAGRKIRTTRGSLVKTYAYDVLGRCIKKTEWVDENTARVSCKSYDLLNRVIEERAEEADGTCYTKVCYVYDAAGNRSAVSHFDDKGAHTTQTFYTPHGKPCLEIDALGNETITTYTFGLLLTRTRIDPSGMREVIIEDAEGHGLQNSQFSGAGELLAQETHRYDALGRRVSTNTVGEREIIWEYDARGNIVRCTEGGKKTTRFMYNLCGQKIETQQPNGITLHFNYDAYGRQERLYSSDGLLDIAYTYDVKDRIICIKNRLTGQATHRSYDLLGNLTAETLETDLRCEYDYDALGRLTEVILPDQSAIRYVYNGCRLLAIERVRGGDVSYIHRYLESDLSGHLIQEQLIGNAGPLFRTFDERGCVVHQRAPHRSESLTYDAVGNVLSRQLEDPRGSLAEKFAYDPLHRLIREGESLKERYHYAYDLDANRSEKNGCAYELNKLNELLDDSRAKYTYDANGNCTSRTINGITTRYSYDPLNRLICVKTADQEMRYTYDAFHRRLTKRVGEETEVYLYQQDLEIGSYIDCSLQELRIFGQGLAADIGSAIAIEMDQVYVPLHDTSGNLCQLLDLEGNPIETLRYSAFGETSDDSRQPWRFASKRFDPETGFIYFGRRYYVPETGRWLTPDPAGFEDGLNLYAYVHQSPLTHIDPDGQLAFLVGIAVSMALPYAAEYALPYATAYLCPTAAAVLTGVVNGYAGNYAYSDLFFGSAAMTGVEHIGLAAGVILSAIPSRAGGKAVGKAVDVAKNRLTAYVAGEAKTQTMRAVTNLAEHTARKAAKDVILDTAKKTSEVALRRHFSQMRNILPENLGDMLHNLSEVVEEGVAEVSRKAGRNRFAPDQNATGSHTVFRRDPTTGKTSKYETYIPQTNPRNPNPWESTKRFDGNSNHPHTHYNKITEQDISTPHIHDPATPGGIRIPQAWEMP